MPSEMSLASSFDRDLARSYGALVGNEAKLKGNDLVYAPTVNILRTPLWGRAFESMGEDPFLTSSLAVDYIRGLQSEGVIGDVKHFAANNQEGNAQGGSRFNVSAQIDERTLREIYLPAFEAAVKPGALGWSWAMFAFRGWQRLSWLDENVLSRVVPDELFYNVSVTGTKPLD